MTFHPHAYGPAIANILALDGNGARLMPLAGGTCSSPQARARLGKLRPEDLFPGSRAPEAAFSGLWLYFSCLDESHRLSQDIATPEGSFWHGIMHRQEPDPDNSSYWFRRTSSHPVFPELAEDAAALGYGAGPRWDPFAFIDFVEQARRRPGSDEEHLALVVQCAEWQLLFDYCASPAG
ncbi:MAG: hypothetical protein HY235_04725 [Acidobacteria bacterium]|nr:hypothetical protein [Acidobacteriota bacterium]